MQVNVLSTVAGPDGCFQSGLHDLPTPLAKRLIEGGFAVPKGMATTQAPPMMGQPRTTTPTKPPPSRRQAFPEYTAAVAKLATLKTEAGTLALHMADAASKAASSAPASARTSRAEAILAGNEAAPVETGKEELARLRSRRADLLEAIALQEKVITEIVGTIDTAICRNLLSDHRANVRKIAVALLALSSACEASRSLLDELEAEGISFCAWLRPMDVIGGLAVNDLSVHDPFGALSNWFQDAVRAGLLPPDDQLVAQLPQETRELVTAKSPKRHN